MAVLVEDRHAGRDGLGVERPADVAADPAGREVLGEAVALMGLGEGDGLAGLQEGRDGSGGFDTDRGVGTIPSNQSGGLRSQGGGGDQGGGKAAVASEVRRRGAAA